LTWGIDDTVALVNAATRVVHSSAPEVYGRLVLSETLQEIALAAAESLALDDVLARIVQGLVETAGLALARIWLVGPGDVCAACAMRAECPDQTRCLHLVASAGRPLVASPETWARIDGAFRRMPFGARKVGQIAARAEPIWIPDIREDSTWIARPEWARSERICSFAGHPLTFRGELLGVLAVFRREEIDAETCGWLRTFAAQASMAIANAHAFAELRASQASLAHVTRLLTVGELTASIAHEVNQPLTAVVNNANACLLLLPDDVPELDEIRDALTGIIDDAGRASAVVTRVRQLARDAPVEARPLDVRDIIADVVTLARYESTTRRVSLRTELADELPPVLGDRVQLQQVLLNLVMNGLDAMSTVEESQRVLTIRARRSARDGTPETLISVSDVGIGFEREAAGRLFDAFYTTKPQGMGLGLAISRSIIAAHGGRLWAEPNAGPGATFVFSMPDARIATG
jgi:signal transduction histidine kinase